MFISFFEEYLIWITDTKCDDIPRLKFFNDLSVDYLLSFNYTGTFEIFYGMGNNGKKRLFDVDCCHVHGEIKNNNKIVMGVGSNFYNENIHEDYVEFFKFYQRYKYSTDCKYQKWIIKKEEKTYINLPEESNDSYTIIIYGHSLDPTDEDILLSFLTAENAQIEIYYYGEKNKLQIEKNLLKILGRKLFETYFIGDGKRIKLINSKNIE